MSDAIYTYSQCVFVSIIESIQTFVMYDVDVLLLEAFKVLIAQCDFISDGEKFNISIFCHVSSAMLGDGCRFTCTRATFNNDRIVVFE